MPILNTDSTVTSSTTSHSSAINNINYLQPNLFKLVVDRKNYPNLEFFAQSVSHPSVDASPAEVPFRRVTRVSMPADKLSYGEMTANIILDENMNSYIEMHNWVSRMVEENYAGPLDRNANLPPIEADVTVQILTSHNNIARKITYLDAMPISIGNIELEAQNSEGFITYPVTFRFTYFNIS
jgi:hypothetical protein